MRTKVLYITYDGLSDPLGRSQIIPYLSGLADLGFDITILSCEKRDRFMADRGQIRKQLTSRGIEWHYTFFQKSPPLFSTFYNYFFLKKKATDLCRNRGTSIIHCRSYISSLIGLKLKKK